MLMHLFVGICWGFYCHSLHRFAWVSYAIISIPVLLWIKVLCDFDFFCKCVFASIMFDLVPAVHAALTNVQEFNDQVYVYPLICCFLGYGIGIFAIRYNIPESIFPGKFDFLFHSHQLWHCAAFFGMYTFSTVISE